jgi:hypothetical protein
MSGNSMQEQHGFGGGTFSPAPHERIAAPMVVLFQCETIQNFPPMTLDPTPLPLHPIP